ncbi:unnamed protein product [Protopolystoma xenopodis]|uniref:Uncharacterized protein n=1 Tax=Protopolystoma xenopodis TaxID=117903 RepID=A0A448XBF9_9PLAT|nr:unnamed protein product [Protopolystoma xenopodis]
MHAKIYRALCILAWIIMLMSLITVVCSFIKPGYSSLFISGLLFYILGGFVSLFTHVLYLEGKRRRGQDNKDEDEPDEGSEGDEDEESIASENLPIEE